jgi:hypothetical protein
LVSISATALREISPLIRLQDAQVFIELINGIGRF